MPDDKFSFLPFYDVEAFCLYPLLHLAARVRESEVQTIDREKFQKNGPRLLDAWSSCSCSELSEQVPWTSIQIEEELKP